MRLQTFGVVFALICLPIILVLAYYISLQIDTITLQNQYNAKLLSATYDTMSAFELNTANEDLSTVSDSLRTIIEACDNIFFSNLATNMGISNASKSYIQPYIPAILYTLYDGYYICAPTYSPTVVTSFDGTAVSVGDPGVTINGDLYDYDETHLEKQIDFTELADDSIVDYGQLLYLRPGWEREIKYEPDGEETRGCFIYSSGACTASTETSTNDHAKGAEYKTQSVLKTYIPYSARYVQSGLKSVDGETFDADINVIYTLDNYLTIDGTFLYADNRNVYYTKSGYLLPFTKDYGADGVTVTGTDLSARVYLTAESSEKNDTKAQEIFYYNQNEIQQYIEAGYPITIDIIKNFEAGSPYETIIQIDSSNNAIIDNTNSNPNSTSAKLNRCQNILAEIEEYQAQIRNNVTDATDSRNSYIVYEKNSLNELLDGYDLPGSVTDAEVEYILERLRLKINELEYRIELNSAAVYYAKAVIFSKWVADNLYGLKTKSVQDISGIDYSTFSEDMISQASGDSYSYLLNIWANEDREVFQFSDGIDTDGSTEIRRDSSFYTHKTAIIRTSIQYNLNLAMSAYNRYLYSNDDIGYTFNRNTDYSMPIMQQREWEQILNNISIVSFMQGLDCGLKKYNDYAVVSSSNNEIVVSTNNIYYAEEKQFNDELSEYHKYNCPKIVSFDAKNTTGEEYRYMPFASKEIKYDKISTRSTFLPYKYDHKNLACYECINDGNYYVVDIFDDDSSTITEDLKHLDSGISATDVTDSKYTLRKAFYIGIASKRNDVYKMNAIKKSEGFEVLYDGTAKETNIDKTSVLKMDKVKSIEITFGALDVSLRNEASATFSVLWGNSASGLNLKNQPGKVEYNNSIDSLLYSIPTNNNNEYTWNIEVDPLATIRGSFPIGNDVFQLGSIYFNNENPLSKLYQEEADGGNTRLKGAIKMIRVIYK